jgi:hypothetical protein
MAIVVTQNGSDITSRIVFPFLNVEQNLTNEVDTAAFKVRVNNDKLLKEDGGALLQESGYAILLSPPPLFNDDIRISDGASVIFAGKISRVSQVIESPLSTLYTIQCIDHTFQMDRKLVSRTYTNTTVAAIIADIITSFAPGFTTVNVSSSFVVSRIVFNARTISQCFRQLADLVRYDWYVDENKDVHFFPRTTNLAPFSLTNTAGKHVFRSLVRNQDGTQVVNRVKVRGGEYDGTTYTDTITVKGNDTKSFLLPYQMSSLTVEVDPGTGFVTKTVGIEFIDTFPGFDVLYNFQAQSFRFNAVLLDGNKVRYSGKPKTPVVAIVEDAASVAQYGAIEKLIRDTSILTNATARKRAAAELLAFSDVAVDAKFKTYVAGLRTGMLINVNPAGFEDQLLIKKVSFSARTPTTFEYDVQCISSQRYSLLDVLRKILEPESLPTDEREISENLYAASDKITLSDSAAVVAFANAPAVLNTLNFQRFGSGGNTYAFDCTGANALIIVVPLALSVTSIQYGASTLTQDGTLGGTWGSAIYRLNNPTTGSNNITVNGASASIQARAYAISGLNTADPVEGSAASTTQIQHLSLSVAQANPNIWSIGFMLRQIVDSGAPSRSFAPDSGDVEGYDGQTLSNAQMSNIMHHIYTRHGTKKMGSTYSVFTTEGPNEASFVLYNGLSVT